MVLAFPSVPFASSGYLAGLLPIPVPFRVFEQGGKHDGENDFDIVADQVAKVLVVPEV